jgi:hypothetical protein
MFLHQNYYKRLWFFETGDVEHGIYFAGGSHRLVDDTPLAAELAPRITSNTDTILERLLALLR